MGTKGRPTKYKAEFSRMAKKACELGATDKDLAAMFDCSEQTINAWKKAHPDFLESLKGKDVADAQVEQALFKRAVGYSHHEDKILSNSQDPLDPVIVPTTKNYAPDTAACIAWLANRKPDKWKKDPGLIASIKPEGPITKVSIEVV